MTMHVGRWLPLLAFGSLAWCGCGQTVEHRPDAGGSLGGNGASDSGASGGSAASGGDGGTGGCRWGGGASGCPPPKDCGDIGQPCCASYRASYAGCYKAGICWDGICRPDGKPCTDDAECFTGTCAMMPDGHKRCSGPCSASAGVSQPCIKGWACEPVDDAGAGFCLCASAGAESCNGKDDNCDGVIDDAPPGDDKLDCADPLVCASGQCTCLEADCKKLFPCGNSYCNPASEYCLQGLDAGSSSQCMALPAGCGATPTCACLANEPCGDWCFPANSGGYWAEGGLILSCGG